MPGRGRTGLSVAVALAPLQLSTQASQITAGSPTPCC
jgi:hypothetical protein